MRLHESRLVKSLSRGKSAINRVSQKSVGALGSTVASALQQATDFYGTTPTLWMVEMTVMFQPLRFNSY